MQNKKCVGVITLPFTPNYGWLLQTYALQHLLKKEGYEPILIYRKWNFTKDNNGLLNAIKRKAYYNILCRKLYSFFLKNISKTKLYRDSSTLKSVVKDYNLDIVIVGSDQVWRFEHTRGVGYNFFLDFVTNPSVKRISYAASFGVDKWTGTENELAVVKDLLKYFKAVSVREESGVNICRKLFNIEAQVVLDPTLLLNSEDYNCLIGRNVGNIEDFLSTYILDLTTSKDNFIKQIALRKKLQIKPLYVDNRKGNVHIYPSLGYWLSGIRDAQFVIVDSFHGMVFCVIFQKNFLVIANQRRGITRFESFLSMLGLSERLIYDVDNINTNLLDKPIDYGKVNELLARQQKLSIEFLKNNIG